MPVIDVEIVTDPGERLPAGLALTLANRLAEVFASPPGGTWVRLRFLKRDQYAENGGGPVEGVRPIFVSVLKAHLPPLSDRQLEAQQIARIVAALCNRLSENVHVLYLPEASGRIAFGGELKLD